MSSLPPYEEIVRWTVADTTRWLAENHLDEFKDPFKKQGVDGSKLAKLKDTDIDAFKVASTKKRIQLKNAVSNIDRSRLNSLPRTQGMMSTFRNMPSEPVPPPRPPKRQSVPVEQAPPPPSSRHAGYNDDDDDAYSWGDEFDYQSDPEDQDDYINEQQWTPQDNDNTRYDQEETYEAVDDDDDYEEPTNPPAPLGGSGTILEKLQAELTRRGTLKGPERPPVADHSDDSSEDDYVQPQEAPPAPSRRQPPVPKPPERNAPPRPAHRSAPPPPPVEDEDVYEEPEAELVVTKKEVKGKTTKEGRQLPPVPPIPTDDRPPLPPPTGGRKGSRPPPPLPQETQEVYEPMDQGELSRGSKVPAPRKTSYIPPSEGSSRPLPNVPSPTEKPERKARSKNGVPPSPKQDELEQFDWYHKNIERSAAESRLMEAGEDGMYLIRKSKRGGTEQQYTLTIYKQGRVYNLPIRKRNSDGKFALGAPKPNELDFDTVSGLVDYFKKQLIKLNPNAKNAAGSTRLVIPLSK
ncbi:SH2 domain-containing protein 6-like isoform X2 [Haliotis asinina]|uniref:SH2 domain-containing protein 6-like isoform X2 n=1 Tax=Haliotis asinina TaxID=109174 RepID=UPI003531D2CB